MSECSKAEAGAAVRWADTVDSGLRQQALGWVADRLKTGGSLPDDLSATIAYVANEKWNKVHD